MQLLILVMCVVAAASGQSLSSGRSKSQPPKVSVSRSTLGSTCYIRNVLAHPNDYLELTSGNSKAATSLMKGGIAEIDKAGQWKIEKWMIDGKPFFEFNNHQYDKFLSHGFSFATQKLGVLATRASYAAAKDRSNLWEIIPPKLNKVVTIKHARTGGYLYAPKGDLKKRFVQLGSRPNSGTEYKWFITCK